MLISFSEKCSELAACAGRLKAPTCTAIFHTRQATAQRTAAACLNPAEAGVSVSAGSVKNDSDAGKSPPSC